MINSIFAVNIENFGLIFEEGLRLVDPVVQQDVLRFKFEKDRHRKLASVLLLRLLVKKILGLSEFTVSKNAYGKPFLKDYSDFHFNLSHSGDWVVGVVSDRPVGIDIEQIRQMKNSMDVAKRFFSEKEYAFLVETEEKSRVDLFYDIWTKKESLIKAVGKGLSISLKTFTVPFKDTVGTVNYNGIDWSVRSLVFDDKSYKLSLSSFSRIWVDERVNEIPQSELVK